MKCLVDDCLNEVVDDGNYCGMHYLNSTMDRSTGDIPMGGGDRAAGDQPGGGGRTTPGDPPSGGGGGIEENQP